MRRLRSGALAGCIWLASCSRNAPAPVQPDEKKTEVRVDSGLSARLGIKVEQAALLPTGTRVSATGRIETNEDATWQVGAITDGKVISVPARVGDSVQKGQVLAVLHSHDVHDARAAYRQAAAELQRQQALAAQALTVRDRTRRLFDLRAASREQLDSAETSHRSALTGVANAEAEVQKAEYHLTDFLEVPIEPGDHAEHRSAANSLTIKAPATGTVMQRSASVGTVVSAGDPVFTIADLTTLWIIAAVNEADLSRVRSGQQVEITVRAYPERVFPGRVLKLGERLDPQTRSLQVRVLVPNSGGLLKPGMFVNAEFAGSDAGKAIQVPESAIQELDGKSVVFLRTAAEKFEPREVKIGGRSEGRVEVVAGLKEGDPVVVQGGILLKSELLKTAEE